MAMMTSLTGLLLLAADMGLTWGTVQARELDQNRLNALFWSTTLLGVAAGLLCVFGAPAVARFYDSPRLIPISYSMGFFVFLSNLSIVPMAILRRQIRQKPIAIVQIVAASAGTCIAIIVALSGGEYWSLVAQSIVPSLLVFASSIYGSGFRPGLPRNLAHAVPVLSFGGAAGSANMVNYFQSNVNIIVIGYFCGAQETGFVSRAMFLRALPMVYAVAVFQDIMLPSLVALRDDVTRFGAAYRKALKLIAFVGCPLGAWLGVTAPESIMLVYGDRWAPVAPLLVWLSFPATVMPIQITVAWLYLATGESRRLLWQAVIVTPLIVVASLIGVGWGASGAVIATALAFTFPLTFITLYLGHRSARIDLGSTIRAVAPILGACGIGALAALTAGSASTWLGMPWYGTYAVKTLTGGAVYIYMVYVLDGELPLPWSFRDLVWKPRSRPIEVV